MTGAGSGIGLEIARRFLAEGAHVIAVDCQFRRDFEYPSDGKWLRYEADLLDSSSARDIFQSAYHHVGKPSILVNNAGRGDAKSVLDTSDEEWDRYLSLNLRTVFRMSREAVRNFGTSGGVILNIASVLGLMGLNRSAPYSAAKAAVVGLTRQMAADYGENGVRVNAIAPGLIATPATAARMKDAAFHDLYVNSSPLCRAGKPEDIAMAAAFLCSPEAGFITGHVLAVDGGWSATKYRRREQ